MLEVLAHVRSSLVGYKCNLKSQLKIMNIIGSRLLSTYLHDDVVFGVDASVFLNYGDLFHIKLIRIQH